MYFYYIDAIGDNNVVSVLLVSFKIIFIQYKNNFNCLMAFMIVAYTL